MWFRNELSSLAEVSLYMSFCPPQIPSQSLWDMWWTKWQGDKFFSSTWAFPCHFHSTSASNIRFIYHRRCWQCRLTEHSSVSFSEYRVIILSDKWDGELTGLLGPQGEFSDKISTFFLRFDTWPCSRYNSRLHGGNLQALPGGSYRAIIVVAPRSQWYVSVCTFGIQLPMLNANRAVESVVRPSVAFTMQQAFCSCSEWWSTVARQKWRRHWLELCILRYDTYDMIYLLTAVGLTPGGSSTVHIYTHTNTEQHNETIYRTEHT